MQRTIDEADKRARDKAAMPAACKTPTGCRENGCHGDCLPPSANERQDAYRCIAPACKPLGCSMCNCAVPADVYAALLTPLHGEIERLRDVAREAADAATKHQAEVLRLRAEVKALRGTEAEHG